MRRWFLILVVVALALPVAALAQSNLARLRVVQALPSGPPLDMFVNGQAIFGTLELNAVTPYALVIPGITNLRAQAAGTGEETLFNVDAELTACTDYTLVTVGLPGSIEPLLLLDDNSPPAPGQARVRFVNASPDAPPVDVALQGGDVLFSNVPFKGAVGYASLNSGTDTFEVREAGTQNPLLTVADIKLDSCTVYTIYLAGLVKGQPSLEAFVAVDAVTACVAPAPTAVQPAAATPPSTRTPVPIIVPRPVVTATPSAAPPTATATLAPTVVTASATPTVKATVAPPIIVTVTPQASATVGPIVVVTATALPTPVPTVVATATAPPTALPTVIVTATAPPTTTPTETAVATATTSPTPTATSTLTATVTPTATATATPTATATAKPHKTPTATSRAVDPFITPAPPGIGGLPQGFTWPNPWWR